MLHLAEISRNCRILTMVGTIALAMGTVSCGGGSSNGNAQVVPNDQTLPVLTPSAKLYQVAGDINATDPKTSIISNARKIALGANGKIYVSDTGRAAILEILPDGTVTSYIGALQSNPVPVTYDFQQLVVDSADNLYIAASSQSKILKITPARTLTTFAGSAYGHADGTGENARFRRPHYLAKDRLGNLYVADIWDKTVRKITIDGTVTTLAGICDPVLVDMSIEMCQPEPARDGPRNEARFANLNGIAVDHNGTVYVADGGTIRKIDTNGYVTTLAGMPTTEGNVDGVGQAARFNGPSGISVDESGNVYVADTRNASIRKITVDGQVSTVAKVSNVSRPVPPLDLIVTSPHTMLILTSTSVQRLEF